MWLGRFAGGFLDFCLLDLCLAEAGCWGGLRKGLSSLLWATCIDFYVKFEFPGFWEGLGIAITRVLCLYFDNLCGFVIGMLW